MSKISACGQYLHESKVEPPDGSSVGPVRTTRTSNQETCNEEATNHPNVRTCPQHPDVRTRAPARSAGLVKGVMAVKTFIHPALQELTDQQVRFVPPTRRLEQLARAERLMAEL